MRRLLLVPPLSLLLAVALPSAAEDQDLYASAMRIVQDRYLWPDTLDPHEMLAGAVERLSDQIEWLLVEPDGEGFLLRDGDGAPMGRVEARRLSDLPDALRRLEGAVASAPWPLDPELRVEVEILRGAIGALDRPSTVLAGNRLERFTERIRGTLEGIGARIGVDEGVLVVRQVFPGGPADEGGLHDGDHLLRIDGVSTLGMDAADATERIRGPTGSTVALEIARAGTIRTVRLLRREVSIPNLEDRVLDGGAAYIRISHFSEQTVDHLRVALATLASRGALERGLVLDLRGNTGGSMIQAARSADQFLVEGRLVRTVGREGAPVSNLVREMDADDEGTEPPVPLVVLTDPQSASGSEILAGSLMLLDRAVILGERTFGKGTVQKIFNLRADVRLKLTVAEYLLAGDRSVASEGLEPDVPTGRVVFDQNGVRWLGGADDAVCFVEERAGWGGQEPDPDAEDPLVAFAARVLAASRGPHREEVRRAARAVEAAVRAEQDALLVRTFARRGIDWSAATAGGEAPSVRVDLSSDGPPRAGDRLVLRARVENVGATPLHRVRVVLRSEDPLWNGLVLPVGRLGPGQDGEGRRELLVPAGHPSRADRVAFVVEADRRPSVTASDRVLVVEGRATPALAIRAQAVPEPSSGRVRVDLVLANRGAEELRGVRARFEFPEDESVSLVDREAIVDRLAPGAEERASLSLSVGEAFAGERIPLELRVDADGFGRLLAWDFPVPLDGRPTAHEAPSVAVRAPLEAPAGEPLDVAITASDDVAIDHATVFVNGRKVAWVRGDRRVAERSIVLHPEPGANQVAVVAEDQEGRRTRVSAWVLGRSSEASTLLAGPPGDEDLPPADEETAP